MRASLPTLRELPSVKIALKWLLPPERNVTDRSVLMHARLCGLIQLGAGGRWSVNGAMATRLANAALRRLPTDPRQLGDVLHGLGEMAARSHATFEESLIRSLRLRAKRLRLDELLNAAFARDAKIRHPVQFDTIAKAQWLSRTGLDWDTFTQALNEVEHGGGLGGDGRYGLEFTARIVLAINARVIDCWIQSHADEQGLATIASAAMSMALPFNDDARATSLLRSRNPAIRCIAAAAIVCPVNRETHQATLRKYAEKLIAFGIEPSDAIWMTGIRIKRAIHQRYGLEHQRKETVPRLQYIEKNPDAAIGGSQNADAEMRMLRAQLDRNAEQYEALLPELEEMLCDMAADWPADGLSDRQMASLENIFVDTAEIRHRLAEKLVHQSNRDWLLKQNLMRLKEFIGITKNPTEISTTYFQPHEDHFMAIAAWAAQSLVLLYATDNRGVGRRASDIVAGIAKAATELIAQPFISARKPEVWQTTTARAACAVRFSFMVVASVPDEQRNTIAVLKEHALNFAFTLLSAENIPVDASYLFTHLAADALQQIGTLAAPDIERERWALAEELNYFARALALWSSPALVIKHEALASELFKKVGMLPLSKGARDVRISQMLSLLDMAIASCATANNADLLARIVWLWTAAYDCWNAINNRWAPTAEMLAKAVMVDGPERAQLVSESVFSQSYCRRLIDLPSTPDN